MKSNKQKSFTHLLQQTKKDLNLQQNLRRELQLLEWSDATENINQLEQLITIESISIAELALAKTNERLKATYMELMCSMKVKSS